MAKLGTAQITARSNTHRAVARRAGRSITFYPLRVRAPNENRGLEIRVRRVDSLSVELKIKCHGRNHFDRLAVNQSWPRAPLLHRGDSGIGERGLPFQKFLHLDAAILLHPHLKLHETLQTGPLRECRIRRLRKIDQSLLEILRSLGHASPEFDFQTVEPALEPVHLGFGRRWRLG